MARSILSEDGVGRDSAVTWGPLLSFLHFNEMSSSNINGCCSSESRSLNLTKGSSELWLSTTARFYDPFLVHGPLKVLFYNASSFLSLPQIQSHILIRSIYLFIYYSCNYSYKSYYIIINIDEA